ncbi:hypothetical protein IIB51_01985 [Patescibacteria group bacterium]|nr:hypothetical protein [Patescibacteria group bacterium]
MNNNESEPEINEDDIEFDIDGQEKIEASIFSQVLRGVVALVVISGLLYISGIYQFFIYQRTPPSLNQAEIVSRVDAQTLSIPLTIFIITGNESYGSIRSEENALHLVENASRIWDQAGITLTIKNIYTISKSDVEMKIFSDTPAVFIQNIDEFDEATINVFLVGNLGGINGIAFSGLYSVAVADYTTVYDFRALAHEVGHMLGLNHVAGSRGQLMYRGANGFELSLVEIERARLKAREKWEK